MNNPPKESCSVFAKFRKGRLSLVRHVSREAALAFARTVRRDRFHDREAVYVVDDLTGTVLEEGATPSAGASEVADGAIPEPAPPVVAQRVALDAMEARLRESCDELEGHIARAAQLRCEIAQLLLDRRALLDAVADVPDAGICAEDAQPDSRVRGCAQNAIASEGQLAALSHCAA